MKSNFIFLLLVLVTVCCTQRSKTSVAVSALIDVTDPMDIWLTSEPVLRMFDCPGQPDQACSLRIRQMNDLKLTPVFTVFLPAAETSRAQGVGLNYRNEQIRGFYTDIREQFKEFYQLVDTTTTIANSLCFDTIADELQVLAKNISQKRVLIINSNLFENSHVLNVYTTKGQDLLLNHPDVIIKDWNDLHLLPDSLPGIQVVFVYKPHNRIEDLWFDRMINHVYRPLLEGRAATVSVQATNTAFAL